MKCVGHEVALVATAGPQHSDATAALLDSKHEVCIT